MQLTLNTKISNKVCDQTTEANLPEQEGSSTLPWIEKDYGIYKVSRVNDKIQSFIDTPAFSCDLETTHLVPSQGKIRLIQIYINSIKTVYIIDLFDDNPYNDCWIEVLLEKLADRQCFKIWHNGLFDMGWLYYHYKVMSLNNFDSMIASQIIKAGKFWGFMKTFKSAPNSLGFLCEESGYPHNKDEQKSDWSNPVITQSQIDYAARDAYYTYQLAKASKDFLYKNCLEVTKAEMGCLPAFVYMNHVGLPCDKVTLEDRLKEYSDKALEIENRLKGVVNLNPDSTKLWYDTYYEKKPFPKKFDKPGTFEKACLDTEFNPSSAQNVGKWLTSLVPIADLLKTDNKTGKTTISTGKATLFNLYTSLQKQELLDLIAYRSIKGAASKFASYLASYQEATRSIASSYTVLATQGTGRSSSGRKAAKGELKFHNAQNFSKHLNTHISQGLKSTRSIIQAREGYSLVEIDASASHMQFARHLSQDKSLIESNNTGLKIHYYTLASILKQARNMDVTPQEVERLVLGIDDKKNTGDYKNLYRLAKTVIYAYLNKAGASTLQSTFFNLEVAISKEDCQMYLEACASQYAGLTKFQMDKFNKVKRTLKATYVNGRYIGHFATSHHMDGATTYHQAKVKPSEINDSEDDSEIEDETEYIPATRDLYLKISDVVSSCWLRPEASIMKKSLGEVFQFQLDSQLPFHLVNFSHDSYCLEVNNDVLSEVVPHCFDLLNNNFIELIPDYLPEGTWQDCVIGYNSKKHSDFLAEAKKGTFRYWEKP